MYILVIPQTVQMINHGYLVYWFQIYCVNSMESDPGASGKSALVQPLDMRPSGRPGFWREINGM